MGQWIDFKQLREQLDFAAVLAHYGVAIKATAAGQHKSRCPLPSHPKDGHGLAFSANLKRGIWRCFSCPPGTAGNCLDFAVRMEGGSPKNPADVRRVALKLQEIFIAPAPPRRAAVPARDLPQQPPHETTRASVVVNKPLDFALKNLSTDHPFFHRRSLMPQTLEHFGMGYCTKGMIAGRIAIPLSTSQGLIGYAGRLTDEFEVTADQPRYVWPNQRERQGQTLVFDRTRFLYHAHALKLPIKDLVVVQWPESAWPVYQAGFRNVVALMNDGPSGYQSKAIVDLVSSTGRIWILPDGSKIGERCAADLFYDVGRYRFCTWLKINRDQPANCSADDLRAMLTWTGA